MPDASTLTITLSIDDRFLIDELSALPDGPERQEFAVRAMHVGALAFQQAQGRIDADRVRNEGQRIIVEMERRLGEQQAQALRSMNDALRLYFDPDDGRFTERVRRLVDRDDGDLAATLRIQMEREGRLLEGIMERFLGPESALLALASPDAPQGLTVRLNDAVQGMVAEQRAAVLSQFSLDNPDSGLSRLVAEIGRREGESQDTLDRRIARMQSEFSLDRDDSALSRLLRHMEQSQLLINRELSLDSPESALARMHREVMRVLDEQRRSSEDFQVALMSRMAELQSRRQERDRSTRHGAEFEDDLYQLLLRLSQDAGDLCTQTGNQVGFVPNSKRGDITVRLGPDNVAAGARIVIEAKQDASYDVGKALNDMKPARENRRAGVGIFVFSARTAPAGVDRFRRYDHDLVVVWNAEDPQTDVYVEAALMVARGLSVRARQPQDEPTDLDAIEKAVIEVARQADQLDDIRTSGETAQRAITRMTERGRIVREGLERQVAILRRQLQTLTA